MNSLVTAALKSGDVSTLVSFPSNLMRKDEREIIEWIRAYRVKYHTAPRMERLQTVFPSFIPIDMDFTPEELVEETLTRKKDLAIQDAVSRLLEREEDPVTITKELQLKLTLETSEVIAFSEFDRSDYFIARDRFWLLTDRITKLTGGILDGELAYIVGRLGTGKTLLSQWAIYNWWLSGRRILMTSNEMPPLELMARFDGFVTGINPLLIRRGEVSINDPRFASLGHLASCYKGDILIPKNRPRCPAEINALIEKVKPDVVVVDGVYLLQPDSGRSTAMWESVAAVSRALKQLALDQNIPIIGVHQANRNAKDKVTAYDISYSDAIGQDADIVVGISTGLEDGDVLVELVKNRGGPSIGVTVKADFDTMMINEEEDLKEL